MTHAIATRIHVCVTTDVQVSTGDGSNLAFTLPRGDHMNGFVLTLRIAVADVFGAAVSVMIDTVVVGPILPGLRKVVMLKVCL